MRVLVTGAAGYLGSVLCGRLLDAGHSVMAVDNLMYGQTSLLQYVGRDRFVFKMADVRRPEWKLLLAEAEVVIPLAAIVGAPACKRERVLATDTNYKAVAEVACSAYHNPIIVFPQTNSCYGMSATVCTESSPFVPLSHYAETKCMAETIVLRQPKGISLRLATVFGPSARPRLDLLVNDFTYRAWKDRSIHVFEGHARRNYIHIQDVCDAFLFAIQNAPSLAGRAWNVGNDSLNMTKLELAHKVAQSVTGVEVLESNTGNDPDKRDYVVSSEAIRTVGFEAKRTLDHGIGELVKMFDMLPRSQWGNA